VTEFIRKLTKRMQGLCKQFAANDFGGLAVSFAVASPVLIGALGIAVDLIMFNKVKADLQSAADAAAVAGAREIQVARSDTKQVTSAAFSYAAFALMGDSAATAQQLGADKLVVDASVVNNFSAVKVNITENWTPFFAHFLKSDITPVTVTATARFVGSSNICVLGLSGSDVSVNLDKNSTLTGNNCGVFADSSDAASLQVDTGAKLNSSLNCAVGGAKVDASATVSPKALTGCPVVPDPLSSRPAPVVGGCDHTDLVIIDESRSINPGVYCGGLTLAGKSDIVLNPGTYIMKDGSLELTGQAIMRGAGVSFFVTGANANKIHFSAGTTIELAAPTSGPMAGLLFFEDRALTVKLKHQITSDNARKLIGTVYLPVGDLIVDAANPVADQSAWTAIIVNHLQLKSGPNLILNSDYTATSVPVPEGIKGTSQVILTQ
jgi:Flp pilus assembly protein TadG